MVALVVQVAPILVVAAAVFAAPTKPVVAAVVAVEQATAAVAVVAVEQATVAGFAAYFAAELVVVVALDSVYRLLLV